jgi:hypothetical protein
VAKSYAPEEFARGIFLLSMAGIAAWIAAAFIFVILRQ